MSSLLLTSSGAAVVTETLYLALVSTNDIGIVVPLFAGDALRSLSAIHSRSTRGRTRRTGGRRDQRTVRPRRRECGGSNGCRFCCRAHAFVESLNRLRPIRLSPHSSPNTGNGPCCLTNRR